MTLAMPRRGRPCRCLMDAAGPGSWPGGGGDTMNASDIDAGGGRPCWASASGRAPAHSPTYQGKTPCPNQPHPVRIRALPPPGRAHPLTAPPRPSRRSLRCHRRSRISAPPRQSHRRSRITALSRSSRRSRRCHRRSRRRIRAHSGPRLACSARRCRRCARCCAEPPAMRSPGRRAGGPRPSRLAVRPPAYPRSRDRRRRGALRRS
jgi:hypothetical protein